MSPHQHLSSEEVLERASAAAPSHDLEGCAGCDAEISSLSLFLADLKRSDAEGGITTEWDDLLLRRRIREAVAQERPHPRSIFDRFTILRPALASALALGLAFAVWVPLSPSGGTRTSEALSVESGRLPAWAPLPEESEDEGLAVLVEWTPNEAEMEIARCRSACLSGLSNHEEELLRFEVVAASRSPISAGTPRPRSTSGGSPL